MHSHGAGRRDRPPPGSPQAAARARLHRLLAAFILPLVALAVAGVVLMWPGDRSSGFPSGLGPSTGLVRAELVTRQEVPCPDRSAGSQEDELVPILPPPETAPGVAQTDCIAAAVRLLEGPDEGRELVLDVLSTPVQPFPDAGRVVLSYDPGAEADQQYAFADVERTRPLALLGVLFAVAVIVLGRLTGLRALLGLGLSLLVITAFVLPALIAGSNALLVALAGSALVMFTVLYLAHGVKVQTSIAVLGTLVSLALTVLLAQLFVGLTELTGLGSDETGLISATVDVDLRGLLLAGIVIGSLGVLDDVTVTQSAAVWELHLAKPTASVRELYTAGIRIGKDHIAATVNTLVLAYVGASLPLLVVYQLAGSGLRDVLTNEVVAQEVVRTLVGSLGLVAAVPVTTLLAAVTVRLDRPEREPAPERAESPA